MTAPACGVHLPIESVADEMEQRRHELQIFANTGAEGRESGVELSAWRRGRQPPVRRRVVEVCAKGRSGSGRW
jgi:hypothetical protein